MVQPNCAHCKMRICRGLHVLWYRRETKLHIAQIGYDYDNDGYVLVMMMMVKMMMMMKMMMILMKMMIR